MYGASEGFWRQWKNVAETDWYEFEVVITDELPAGAELTDSSNIGPGQTVDETDEACAARRRLKWRELFPTELREDQMTVAFFLAPDGHQASSVVIRKEIWINIDGRGDGLGDGTRYPVFHVYNYLDPSKAASADSGCRVRPYKEPFLKFEDALAVAEQHAADALASGKWVPVEQVVA
jgi:hypothetical protein